MKGLTLWRPWQEPVAAGVKPVENRPWAPSVSMQLELERGFALHGGKKYDRDGAEWMEMEGLWAPKPAADSPQGIVAVVALEHVVTEMDSPWFFGPYGWVLRVLWEVDPPVPCRGAQGLWELPPDVESEVLRRRHDGACVYCGELRHPLSAAFDPDVCGPCYNAGLRSSREPYEDRVTVDRGALIAFLERYGSELSLRAAEILKKGRRP